MKLLLFSLAALSILNPTIAVRIHSNEYQNPSLFARGPPVESPPDIRPGSALHEPVEVTEAKPIVAPDGTLSVHSTEDAIQNLPRQQWVRQLVKISQTRIDILKRLVGIRPGYRGDPADLYDELFITDEDGVPTGSRADLTPKQISRLKEVKDSRGMRFTLSEKFETIKTNPRTGEIGGVYDYKKTYVSPYWAVSGFLYRHSIYREARIPDPAIGKKTQKRSGVLQEVSGQPGSDQDAAAVFQQYLGLLYSIQSSIGALIAPILNNLTSETNSTLVHQMALSIYYDLTGSTTVLVGPFNYGMSFIGNRSDSTGQGGQDVSGNGTTEISTTIKNIYTSMWTQAFTATNSSGLYAQQLYLAGCLYTNDTSVYPAGFTANATSASK